MDDKLYTIDELANASGVTTRTIRFYSQEKLLDPPVDWRGRTALYGREHLEKLKVIKILKDKYLPLDMIKKVSADPAKLAVLKKKLEIKMDIFKLLGYKPGTIGRKQLAKKGGITEAEIEELIELGFIMPGGDEDGADFTEEDVEIMETLGEFGKIGLSPDEIAFIPDMLQELTNTLFNKAHAKFHQKCAGELKEGKAKDIEALLKANQKLVSLLYRQSLRRTHRRAVEENNGPPV